ncbi:hypothetical protein THAOC_33099 [Thalassiosira oceanica]|uniref:Uncharacterized protein n=1 Tax=Thalassiosira oceanica TaxID=159749 RepID=K0R4P8_THAOC|nr:hypothetical protein THAOC_33099 [Thalassiosira oceanica]|eukprot:EJK48133.1 hypothetical protein THAOC_33099 [Thalassiosira oceanica]
MAAVSEDLLKGNEPERTASPEGGGASYVVARSWATDFKKYVKKKLTELQRQPPKKSEGTMPLMAAGGIDFLDLSEIFQPHSITCALKQPDPIPGEHGKGRRSRNRGRGMLPRRGHGEPDRARPGVERLERDGADHVDRPPEEDEERLDRKWSGRLPREGVRAGARCQPFPPEAADSSGKFEAPIQPVAISASGVSRFGRGRVGQGGCQQQDDVRDGHGDNLQPRDGRPLLPHAPPDTGPWQLGRRGQERAQASQNDRRGEVVRTGDDGDADEDSGNKVEDSCTVPVLDRVDGFPLPKKDSLHGRSNEGTTLPDSGLGGRDLPSPHPVVLGRAGVPGEAGQGGPRGRRRLFIRRGSGRHRLQAGRALREGTGFTEEEHRGRDADRIPQDGDHRPSAAPGPPRPLPRRFLCLVLSCSDGLGDLFESTLRTGAPLQPRSLHESPDLDGIDPRVARRGKAVPVAAYRELDEVLRRKTAGPRGLVRRGAFVGDGLQEIRQEEADRAPVPAASTPSSSAEEAQSLSMS